MKFLIESHQYMDSYKTGIGYYSNILIQQISSVLPENDKLLYGIFSDSEKTKILTIKAYFSHKVSAKLQTYGIRIPAEVLWGKSPSAFIYPDFLLFPSMSGKKTAVAVHDLNFLYNPDHLPSDRNKLYDFFWPGLATYLKRVVSYSIKKADLVIATSNTMKAELIDMYGIPDTKIVVSGIPPTQEFIPGNNPIKGLPELPTKKFIYYQGTIEPRKNHLALLSAYEQLPDNIKKKYSLVLCGKIGWKCQDVLDKIKSLQENGDNVVHTGYVTQEQKVALFQNCSLYVQPSHYEGFGMPVLEAMACGAPIACSNIAVFRELTAGKAGLFFNQNNPKDIGQTMLRLLNDVALSQKIVNEGKKRVKFYRDDLSGIRALVDALR